MSGPVVNMAGGTRFVIQLVIKFFDGYSMPRIKCRALAALLMQEIGK